MGSLCGCQSKLLELEDNRNQQNKQQSFKKYQDIVPDHQPIVPDRQPIDQSSSHNLIDNENSLWKLNQHLSTLVCTFEAQNGQIGQSFLGRDDVLKDIGNIQLNSNISIIGGNKIQVRNKVISNARIIEQSHNQSHKNNKSITQNILQPQVGHIDKLVINRTINKVISEEDESEIEQDSQEDNTYNYNFTRKTLCLDSSLRTEYIQLKDIFYDKYNTINNILLGKWVDQGSNGQTINLHQITHNLSLKPHSIRNSFNNLLLTALGALQVYALEHSIKLISSKVSQSQYQIRLFINGKQNSVQQNLLNALNLFKPLNQNQVKPSGMIYYLSGWIPQSIKVQQITNINNIMDRVNNNFKQGHTIISFSHNIDGQIIYSYLKSIDFQQKTLQIANGFQSIQQNDNKLFSRDGIDWEELVNYKTEINVNWNPLIYDYIIKLEGYLNVPDNNRRNQFTQCLLRIPPCKDDIELRVFLEIHSHEIPKSNNCLSIAFELYDYHGHRIYNGIDAIRVSNCSDNGSGLYSDVFIFQGAEQKTQYILVIAPSANSQKTIQQYQYTLSAYSFNEVQIKLIAQPKVASTVKYTTMLKKQNTGYSINSPIFTNNLHFSVNLPPLSLIEIITETTPNHHYDINIIADPYNSKDITNIPLENMLNENYKSCECQGNSGYEFISNYQSYIFVIATYNAIQHPFTIIINCLEDNQEQIQSKQNHAQIQIKQLIFQPKFIIESKIKWNQSNFGPRKRLKSNSTPVYHPHVTFQQFFNNPLLDYHLQAGTYQFNVISETFIKIFTQTQNASDKIMLEPPSLSLNIMRISPNGKSYKIINDDAFYVPFGIGYWSQNIYLEEANYRFIFPKIEKDNTEGIFRVRKLSDK